MEQIVYVFWKSKICFLAKRLKMIFSVDITHLAIGCNRNMQSVDKLQKILTT